MTIPVSVSQVRNVLPEVGKGFTDPQIQSAIDAADAMMQKVVTDCGSDLSDQMAEQAEIQLAGHFSLMINPSAAIIEESIDGKSRMRYGSGSQNQNSVLGTQYGRNANMLAGGCLSQMEKTPARMFSIGSIGE